MDEVSDDRSEHEHDKDGDSTREGEGGEAESELLALAPAEAARERSMFAKLDKRSYTELNRSRMQRPLLSMIFHPDLITIVVADGLATTQEHAAACSSEQHLFAPAASSHPTY